VGFRSGVATLLAPASELAAIAIAAR